MSRLLQVLALTEAALRRLVREGMVLRALGAPAVLLTATVLATAVVVVAAPESAPVAVADAALVDKLAAVGVRASLRADPLAALEGDPPTADRAVVQDAAGTTLHLRPSGWARWSARRGHEDLLIESVVREHVAAGWRLSVPRRPGIGRDLPQQVRTLLRLLGVLFTLYAVVLVVAGAVRDRESGALEALGAAALPPWVGPLGRGLAVFVAVSGSLAASQLLLAALFGADEVAHTLLSSLLSVAAGVAIGTLAPTGRGWRPLGPYTGAPAGLSAPLSQALVGAMSLASLGVMWPSLGAWLPLAGLLAAQSTAATQLCSGLVALVIAGLAVRRAGRARW